MMNFDTINAVQRNLRFLDPDGKRQDAASQYLHPKLTDSTFPNLQVVTNTSIVRVLIENGTAVGVETAYKKHGSDSSANEDIRIIMARKLVVLSCGALGSPLVLERSGVGEAKHLQDLGVPIMADLPGVGRGYEDHQVMIYSYKSSLRPEETMDALAGGRVDVGELIKHNDPILGWNCQDVTSKIRPSDDEALTLGTTFQETWEHKYKPFPDRPLVHLTLIPM